MAYKGDANNKPQNAAGMVVPHSVCCRGGWAERLRSGFSGVRGNGAGAAVRLRQVGLLPRRDPARRILSTKAVGQDPDGVDCLGQHRSRCKAPG
jgi:hypothetical protein